MVAGEARGGRRASWQPTSAERGREVESQEVWREEEGKRGVGLDWESGTEGGQSSGRRRAVSHVMSCSAWNIGTIVEW